WYRHWLEVRRYLLAGLALGTCAAMIVCYVVASGVLPMGRIVEGVLRHAGVDVDRETLRVLTAHAYASTLGIAGQLVLLVGSGIRSFVWREGTYCAEAYTLSLPVPRWRWVATRFVVTCAAALAMAVTTWLGAVAVLHFAGHPVPYVAMSMISAYAALVAVTLYLLATLATSFSDALLQNDMTAHGFRRRALVMLPMFVGIMWVMQSAWPRTVGYAAGGGAAPWIAIAVPVVTSAAALALILIARSRHET